MLWLKAKLTWVGAAILTALSLFGYVRSLKYRAEKAEAKSHVLDIKHKMATGKLIKTTDILAAVEAIRAASKSDIKKGRVPDHVSNPD